MDMKLSIQEARTQMDIAKSRFDFAITDDEIDSAIAHINAAEMDYLRLVKLAKREKNKNKNRIIKILKIFIFLLMTI